MGPDEKEILHVGDGQEENVRKMLTDAIKEKQSEIEKNEYILPDSESVFVDEADGSIKETTDLTYWEQIKFVAKEHGVDVNEPKKSCKVCYGRGYSGWEVDLKLKRKKRDDPCGSPVPCYCIFPIEVREKEPAYARNHASNRKMKLMEKRFMRNIIRKARREQRDGWELKQEGK